MKVFRGILLLFVGIALGVWVTPQLSVLAGGWGGVGGEGQDADAAGISG